jgi:hypothetical protein
MGEWYIAKQEAAQMTRCPSMFDVVPAAGASVLVPHGCGDAYEPYGSGVTK